MDLTASAHATAQKQIVMSWMLPEIHRIDAIQYDPIFQHMQRYFTEYSTSVQDCPLLHPNGDELKKKDPFLSAPAT